MRGFGVTRSGCGLWCALERSRRDRYLVYGGFETIEAPGKQGVSSCCPRLCLWFLRLMPAMLLVLLWGIAVSSVGGAPHM